MKQHYQSHFVDAYFIIKDYIDVWPDDLNSEEVIKFTNFDNATMLFIPVNNENGKDVISRQHFYCSICKKWLKICESIKQLKMHASIHVPEIFKEEMEKKKTPTNETKKFLIKNIIDFVLFENNSFQSIESIFLKNIIRDIPSREKLAEILPKIANFTRKEIKALLAISSANYLTFDQCSDSRKREFLGITIRSYISRKYHDFFLDLIYLFSEINDVDILSNEILKSIKSYGLLMTENILLYNRQLSVDDSDR